MDSRSPRTETIAYLFAFIVALGMRFILLGKLPLTDPEATWALQALKVSQGGHTVLGSQVAYVNLTAVLFFVFGSFNFLARFLPALAGSVLVLAPALFRDRLRSRVAILLAFFLAIDPGLVALSRQAGSPILAVTFSVFAAGFWFRKNHRLAGFFAALALLSGPALWAGLLGLLLAWMISHFLAARPKTEEMDVPPDPEKRKNEHPSTAKQEDEKSSTDSTSPTTEQRPLNPDYRSSRSIPVGLITAFILTLFLISSLFLLAPQGLGAWLAALPEYLKGWVTPSLVPSSRMFLALGVYQLLGVLWAVIAIVRGWMNGSPNVIRFSLWLLVALLLASFYPARQTADLVWALLPLWILAAHELSHHITVPSMDRLETAGVAVFTLLLLGFAWMDFVAMYFTPLPSSQGNLRLGLLIGALLLLAVSVILVGYGWSGRIARVGAAWGVTILLGLYTLGSAWGATGLRIPGAVELWDAGAPIVQAELLSQTADDISEWATGQVHDLPVTVYGVDSPALLWALRNHKVEVVQALDPASAPPLVVTPPQGTLQLASAYRGQDFNWRQTPVWDVFSSFQLQWLTLRDLPAQPEVILLWARNDLFVDAAQP